MALADLYRKSLSLLLLMLAVAPVHLTHEHVPEVDQHVPETAQRVPEMGQHVPKAAQLSEEAVAQLAMEEVMQAVKKVVMEYNNVPIPGFPINIPGDKISISMTLADIYLQGLKDVEVLDQGAISGSIKNKTAHGAVEFNKISLLVGSYSSTGHLNNLPLNGEGSMYLRLHKFFIAFSIKWHLKPWTIIPCVEYNTSHVALDIQRMETLFENLNVNEGGDLGQVVDIVLPSFARDIVKQLQVLLSTTYYQTVDSILVGLINIATKCTKGTREDILKTEELLELIDQIVKDLIP